MSIYELALIETKCVSGAADGGEGGSNGNLNDHSATAAEVATDCGLCVAASLATYGAMTSTGPAGPSVATMVGASLGTSITCGQCVNGLLNLASNGATVTANPSSWQTQFESKWFGD